MLIINIWRGSSVG